MLTLRETKIVDLRSQLSDVNLELHSEKQEVMNRERKNEGFLEKLMIRNVMRKNPKRNYERRIGE